MAVPVDGLMAYAYDAMPERAPLPMERQNFQQRPAAQTHGAGPSWADRAWRFAAFAPALGLTLAFCVAIARWLGHGGVTALEVAIVLLVAITFVWVSLPVSSATLGIIRSALRPGFARYSATRGAAQKVALLMPIYNEAPAEVFGNAMAMLQELQKGPQRDDFTLFVLSDTRDAGIAALEERAFRVLHLSRGDHDDVHYRRRAQNTDKKVGNITDWIENWGAGFDAMIVLDADSLMSGSAIRHLAHEMAADPDAGLIQSFPSLIDAKTLFGRMQQFSNAVYGWLLAEGLTVWSQREGNYWGHNAIIRVRAFAESAHLPYLRRWGGRDELILSHDFVEAGLLRRAGWGVRFLPRTCGSYEQTPQTLIDYALRDRRWCQGNLQHLRLLTTRGFHPVSRFHLLQGACAFLLSPMWFALLVIWSMVGTMPEATTSYFSPTNPLRPIWPDQDPTGGALFLIFIYGMLLLPKILGATVLCMRPATRAAYGGWPSFSVQVVIEILCSILYAPIMMVQQTLAVVFAILGRGNAWTPQQRGVGTYGWTTALRFHMLEVGLGALLFWGILAGAVSLWLVPIAISLTLAPLLSLLSAVGISDLRLRVVRLDAPHDLREPRVVVNARKMRAWMTHELQTPQVPIPVAAE